MEAVVGPSPGEPVPNEATFPPKTSFAKATYFTRCIYGQEQIGTQATGSSGSLIWKPLDVYNEPRANAQVLRVKTWDHVPFSALAGCSPNSANNFSADQYPDSINSTFFANFMLHRLVALELVYKEFQYLTEKTSPGGTQLSMKPVFHVGWLPNSRMRPTRVAMNINTLNPDATTLPENGVFKRYYNAVMSPFLPTQFFFEAGEKSGWVSVAAMTTPSLTLPMIVLDKPLEEFSVHVSNTPPGATDSYAWVKYTIELKGIWEHKFFFVDNTAAYFAGLQPTSGSEASRGQRRTRDTNLSDDHLARKKAAT